MTLQNFRCISLFPLSLDGYIKTQGLLYLNKDSVNNGQGASAGYSAQGYLYCHLAEVTNLGEEALRSC